MEHKLNISWEFLWKIFFMVVLSWILYLAKDVVVALVLAVVISTAFDPIVSFLEKKRIPRILGALTLYFVTFFCIGLFIYILAPIALQELTSLLANTNKFLRPLTGINEVQGAVLNLSETFSKLADLLFSGNISLVDVATRFVGGVFSVFAIFGLSFYLTIDRGGVQNFLLAILPSSQEGKISLVYGKIEKKIGRWLAGQMFLSLLVALAIFVGLSILGVKYALILGILGGILELIPYVGPVLTGIFAFAVGLETSVNLAIYVLLLFVVIQQLENQVFIPLVNKHTTSLNPAVVLTSLLIGGSVFGIIGIILSVPIAVLFQELISNLLGSKKKISNI